MIYFPISIRIYVCRDAIEMHLKMTLSQSVFRVSQNDQLEQIQLHFPYECTYSLEIAALVERRLLYLSTCTRKKIFETAKQPFEN